MPKTKPLSPAAILALTRLRGIASGLRESAETVSFGHPAFAVRGRTFAVLDRYGGHDCLWLRVMPAVRAEVLGSKGWSASPYDPRGTALICRLDAIDWRKLRTRVRESHALAALAPSKARR